MKKKCAMEVDEIAPILRGRLLYWAVHGASPGVSEAKPGIAGLS